MNRAGAAPTRRFDLGAYHFGQYRYGPQKGKWECSARGRGVGGHKTPWGAWFALRSFLYVRTPPNES